MGLHSIDNITGMLYWKCYHPRPGCTTRSAHIGDAGVCWISESEITLPVCPTCGEQRTLKVAFTEEEKQNDNMIQYGMIPTPIEVAHPVTGEIFLGQVPAFKPVGVNPFRLRNEELARQLQAIGKLPDQAIADEKG